MNMTKEKIYKNNENNAAKNDKPSEALLQGLLFSQVEEPKNMVKLKIVNVFDNRYRINIWTEKVEEGLIKYKITQSYFARFTDNSLIIDL